MSVAIDNFRTDMEAAEAFAEKLGGMFDAGAVVVLTAIGHRLRLFDVMAAMPPATSTAIAERAGLSERYVREWLAGMVTGKVIAYEPASRTYRLPAEHAACLTEGAPLGNLAVYAQHVALLGQVHQRVLACFRTGEGLAYGDYPCFHQIMAEDSALTVVAGLFDTILPLVEGIEARLEAGIDVLDAGCGRGLALIEMARRYPQSRFAGYDLGEDSIAYAQGVVREAGLANIRFERRDLSGFADKACFDFITSFDAVHDQKDPQALIRALKGALRPGGVYLMQDIGGSAKLENNLDFPMAPMLYAISCLHCMPVSLGQGGLGLGTMWGWETAQAMLEEAGFSPVERHVLPHDPMNVWFVAQN